MFGKLVILKSYIIVCAKLLSGMAIVKEYCIFSIKYNALYLDGSPKNNEKLYGI